MSQNAPLPAMPLPAQPLNQAPLNPAFELPPEAGPDGTAPAGEQVVRRRQPKKPNLYGKILGTLAFLVLVGGVATSIYLLITREREKVVLKPGAIEGLFQSLKGGEELAFVVTAPKDEWKKEALIRSRLAATLAMSRTGPDAFFAVCLKDYGVHKARDAEMLREGIKRLDSLFSDGSGGSTLELAAKAVPAQLDGKTAKRMEFRGQFNTVFWRGDLYMLAYHGIAYWVIIASPSIDDARHEMKNLLDSKYFAIQTKRLGWTEQPIKLDLFKGARVQMHAFPGVWEQFKARDEDERADLVLVGRYKEKDNRKNATVLALNLEPQPGLKEGVKAAAEDLEKKKQSELEGASIQPAEEKTDPLNDPGPAVEIGNRRGKIVEFRVVADDMPKRYVLLAVIVEDDRLLVIRCEAIWEHRQIWRQEFLDLLQTLRSG